MFETFFRSIDIVKKCFGVLAGDPTLLVFPLVSTVFLALVAASFALPYFFTQLYENEASALVLLFLFYCVSYFVVIFFNSSLVFVALRKLEGRQASAVEGISFSFSRLPQIAMWAVVAATVGLILNWLSSAARDQKGVAGLVAGIAVSLVGFAWSLATFFVVPVIVVDGTGPLESIRRSIDIIKKTWGEAVVGGAGISLAFLLLYVAAIALAAVLGLATGSLLLAVGLGLVLVLLLFLAQNTLEGIFVSAVFLYATKGEMKAFSREELEGAFRKK
jgi:hypothetical protein